MKKKDIIFIDEEKLLYFDRKLKLKSRELLAFLLKDSLTRGEVSLKYSLEILTKELKFKNWEVLVDSIKEVSGLSISYTNKSYLQKYEELGAVIIENYKIQNESISIKFSKSFFEDFIFSKKLSKYDVHLFIFLWKEQFRNLYYYCKERIENEKQIIMSPKDIKKHLNIEGRYSRYNDFIAKIIVPFLDELNKYMLREARFEKLKIAPKKNLILLEIVDVASEEKIAELNRLLSEYSNVVPGLKMFLKKVMEYLIEYDYNYVKEHLEYAVEKKGLIYMEFIRALKANSCNIEISKKAKEQSYDYIIDESRRFFTKMSYISWSFNLLLKSDMFDNFSSLSMEVLKLIRENKTFSIEREGALIEGGFTNKIGSLRVRKVGE